ncbi:hypothetical protein [Agrococcus sp. ARC_14]|uniref:hypothetical protein n=1 Tax=Agrococcus sp. ARC_14 TaxID=2919927 RepID=UPI001F057BA2|nr:hypothetical protein [Agrococcus sp. ARC_14]MCH1882710.1 hypothetical protein [Agrococcus sp. ARC_14]
MQAPTARVALITIAVPALAAAAAGVRLLVMPGISVALIVAVVLAPVWLGALTRYRWTRALLVLGLLAAAWGALLSVLETARPTGTTLMLNQTGQLLALIGGAGLLLWARTSIGSGWTTTAFGVGTLVNALLMGPHPANPWKYSLAIPISLIVLGLSMHWRSRILPIVVLAGLAAASAASDSRSMTSFLLLAAAALLWQSFAPSPGARPNAGQTLVWLAVAGLAAFMLLQALILDGVLGQAAAQRSEAQLDTSGSLLTGGRPELGAAIALIGAEPLGYGSGTRPVSSDVWLAKSGMDLLGYNPNNGYVEVFMFGGHFEVHSVLGDLWVWFGPLGAAVAILVAATGLFGTASALARRTANGPLVLLTMLGLWDVLFSPMLTSYSTLALLFALAALPAVTAPGVAQGLSPASPPSGRT